MVDANQKVHGASAPAGTLTSTVSSAGWIDAVSWALVLVGALFRILSYFFSANSGGDAVAHAALAAKWLQQPTLKFVFDVYPPGHFWLIGLFALLVHDVATAARLLSLVLGVASLLPLWKLANVLYGRQAARLSLAAFSFYSLHIGYSTTSSGEISYLFFFLLGVYFFFRYVGKAEKLSYLLVSGVCLSVSESVRFEAWVLFGGLFAILAFLSYFGTLGGQPEWWKGLRPLVAFGVSGGTWPVFMMGWCWRTYHDPMYLVTQNRFRVHSFEAARSISRIHELALVPSAIVISLSIFAVLGAVYGIAKSFSSRLTAAFAALTLFFGAVQAYEIGSGGSMALARYTMTLGTLLAVVSGFGLQRICEEVAPKRMVVAHGAVVGLLFLNLVGVWAASEVPNRYAEKFSSVSPRLRYVTRIKEVGDYLRAHLQPNDAVIFDGYEFESTTLADASGLPLLAGRRAYLATNKKNVALSDYIQAEHPRFLVYAREGVLAQTFPLPPGCQQSQVDGIRFSCVFAGEMYRIYELNYR